METHTHSQQVHVPVPTVTGSRVSIDATEREWLRGPLSREVSYRLIVSGDMGAKALGKLIKLLEAQRAVLEDDDEDSLA